MKISKLGEFGLIDEIRKFNPGKGKDIVKGIGDDAAVIRAGSGNRYLLLTTDTIVEGVHFSLKDSTYFELGWKLMAANISDIAAMGGTPKYALVTLGLKKSIEGSLIKDLYRGMNALGKRHGVQVVGGDIVRSPKSIFFTMHIVGVSAKVITRSGARPGDLIISMGRMGGSSARRYKHIMPVPMVKEGKMLLKLATSMIDNSDGLARCVLEICRASGVGAEIYPDKIPLDRGASVKDALNGGEDYNLIATVKKRDIDKVRGGHVIGRITKGKGVKMVRRGRNVSYMKDKGYEQV